MTRLAVLVVILIGGAACKKQSKAALGEAPAMSAAEVKRSEDACKAYVELACACAANVPDVAKQCELARALPEAIQISLSVATSADSKPDVVQQSYDGVRKTAKECIEQTAKLPALGCR